MNGNAWGCPVGPPVTGSYITPSVNIFHKNLFNRYKNLIFILFMLREIFFWSQNTTAGGFQYSNGAETGFKIMPATQPVSVTNSLFSF